MSVIIFILKLIGIILLCILGILLLLLLLILFLPAGYRIEGESEGTWRIAGKAHWLFHILSFRVTYDGDKPEYEFRIFGIRKKKKVPKDEDWSEDEPAWEEWGSERTEDEPFREEWDSEESEEEATREEWNRGEWNSRKSEDKVIREEWSSGKEKTEGAAHRQGRKKKRAKESVFRRIKRFFRELRDKLHRLKDKLFDLKNVIADETNKSAVLAGWKEIRGLLKHFRFRDVHARLEFSLGDPAATGQALGVLSMIPFLYRYAFSVYPDFESEKAYLRGSFRIKGHIRAVHFLAAGIRLWRQKDCRTFLKNFMK